MSLGPSTGQPARERRDLEWPETVMLQPTHVRFEELTQIRHPVFQHGDAVDAHAPGEALILLGIEPAIAQHVGMDHAAAQNLQPVLAFAEADFAALAPALDVDLHRGFGERKERRPEAHFYCRHFEECLAE